MAQSQQAGPVHSIRFGNTKAAIWQNEKGSFTVTFERIYKDGSDNWKSSPSFGRDDLPKLTKVSEAAYEWIFESTQETEE